MNWRVEFRPEVEQDVSEAAEWYEKRQSVEEIIQVWDSLAENPLLNSRRHPAKNIRWRYPNRFPYRVIYEVHQQEQRVVIAAVLHAARQDRHWEKRI